jgi:hypothetical protein
MAYLLPRLEILPRIVRSPVDSCFGTRPSQAPKSRPCLKPQWPDVSYWAQMRSALHSISQTWFEHPLLRTRQDARWHACLTASPWADQHLLRVRSYDLDRIRMELPGTSVERFKRSRRRALSASLTSIRCCKHLNGCPSELTRYLKKLTWYADITRLLNNAFHSNYGENCGKILTWA